MQKLLKRRPKKRLNLVNLSVTFTKHNLIMHAAGATTPNIIVSAGSLGFKGAKRASSFAAQKTTEKIGGKLRTNRTRFVRLIFKGTGKGRKFVIKSLRKKKIKILGLIENTPNSHNGCRQKKKRRL
jgi:small subunit ribosomal protein S11